MLEPTTGCDSLAFWPKPAAKECRRDFGAFTLGTSGRVANERDVCGAPRQFRALTAVATGDIRLSRSGNMKSIAIVVISFSVALAQSPSKTAVALKRPLKQYTMEQFLDT